MRARLVLTTSPSSTVARPWDCAGSPCPCAAPAHCAAPVCARRRPVRGAGPCAAPALGTLSGPGVAVNAAAGARRGVGRGGPAAGGAGAGRGGAGRAARGGAGARRGAARAARRGGARGGAVGRGGAGAGRQRGGAGRQRGGAGAGRQRGGAGAGPQRGGAGAGPQRSGAGRKRGGAGAGRRGPARRGPARRGGRGGAGGAVGRGGARRGEAGRGGSGRRGRGGGGAGRQRGGAVGRQRAARAARARSGRARGGSGRSCPTGRTDSTGWQDLQRDCSPGEHVGRGSSRGALCPVELVQLDGQTRPRWVDSRPREPPFVESDHGVSRFRRRPCRPRRPRVGCAHRASSRRRAPGSKSDLCTDPIRPDLDPVCRALPGFAGVRGPTAPRPTPGARRPAPGARRPTPGAPRPTPGGPTPDARRPTAPRPAPHAPRHAPPRAQIPAPTDPRAPRPTPHARRPAPQIPASHPWENGRVLGDRSSDALRRPSLEVRHETRDVPPRGRRRGRGSGSSDAGLSGGRGSGQRPHRAPQRARPSHAIPRRQLRPNGAGGDHRPRPRLRQDSPGARAGEPGPARSRVARADGGPHEGPDPAARQSDRGRLQLPGPHPRAGAGDTRSAGPLLDVRQRGDRRRRADPASGRHPRSRPRGGAGGRDRAAREPRHAGRRPPPRGRLHGRERRHRARLAGPGEGPPAGREGRRPVAPGQGLGHVPAARAGAGHGGRGRRRPRPPRPKLAHRGRGPGRRPPLPDAGRQHVQPAVQRRRARLDHQPGSDARPGRRHRHRHAQRRRSLPRAADLPGAGRSGEGRSRTDRHADEPGHRRGGQRARRIAGGAVHGRTTRVGWRIPTGEPRPSAPPLGRNRGGGRQ